MRNLRYTLLDVFTDRALTGNALAVFTDGRNLSSEVMQDLAREMNLSETVFVLKPDAGGHAKIRIFTPQRELAFAGHPTLGSAVALGGALQAETVRLETGAGIIPVRLERDGARIVFAWMQQPTPRVSKLENVDSLLAALGLTATAHPISQYDNGIRQIIIPVDSDEIVGALKPDFVALARVAPEAGVNVVSVAGLSESTKRVKTRNFSAGLGVLEDPATGSAAGPIAVHLFAHGKLALGESLLIEQGAELKRPAQLFAVLYAATAESGVIERIEVGGAAVVIGRGEIVLS